MMAADTPDDGAHYRPQTLDDATALYVAEETDYDLAALEAGVEPLLEADDESAGDDEQTTADEWIDA